jgi:hypothetical protein
VSFEELTPLPSTSGNQKSRKCAKKHSEILTSTPKKLELELAMERKKLKSLKLKMLSWRKVLGNYSKMLRPKDTWRNLKLTGFLRRKLFLICSKLEVLLPK